MEGLRFSGKNLLHWQRVIGIFPCRSSSYLNMNSNYETNIFPIHRLVFWDCDVQIRSRFLVQDIRNVPISVLSYVRTNGISAYTGHPHGPVHQTKEDEGHQSGTDHHPR